MLVPYALTSLANVKALLGITDTSQDSLLELLINAVTDAIEKTCGRRFKKPASAVTLLLTGTGSKNLFTNDYPIDTITSIKERKSFNSFELIDATKYYADVNAGIIYVDFETIKAPLGYEVIYKAGYDPIPNDLDMAAAQMVVREYNQRAGGGDVQSESLGEYSVTYVPVGGAGASEVDMFIDNTVSKYKRPFI